MTSCRVSRVRAMFLDGAPTALEWEPIDVLLPQSRRLIAFPLPSHPIVSLTVIRRGGWLTLGDDWEFTHSRRRVGEFDIERRRGFFSATIFLRRSIVSPSRSPAGDSSPRGGNLFPTRWREGEERCTKISGVDACCWVIRVLCGSSCASYVRPAALGSANSTVEF